MENNETKALAMPSEGWITLQKAADMLGMTKRTVERFCQVRLLATQYGRPEGAKQKTRLVNSVAVAKLKNDLESGEVTLKWHKGRLAKKKGNLSGYPIVPVKPETALASRLPAVTDKKSPQVARYTAVSNDPWLTVEEAATYSRLPAAYLRRCILASELDARNVLNHTGQQPEEQLHPDGEPKRASWRIKRSAVDELTPSTKEDYVGQRAERSR